MTDNYKGLLQEICQKHREGVPNYTECHQAPGPNNSNIFTSQVHCLFRGTDLSGEGKGKTKKDAEKASALSVIHQLFILFPEIKPTSFNSSPSSPSSSSDPSSYSSSYTSSSPSPVANHFVPSSSSSYSASATSSSSSVPYTHTIFSIPTTSTTSTTTSTTSATIIEENDTISSSPSITPPPTPPFRSHERPTTPTSSSSTYLYDDQSSTSSFNIDSSKSSSSYTPTTTTTTQQQLQIDALQKIVKDQQLKFAKEIFEMKQNHERSNKVLEDRIAEMERKFEVVKEFVDHKLKQPKKNNDKTHSYKIVMATSTVEKPPILSPSSSSSSTYTSTSTSSRTYGRQQQSTINYQSVVHPEIAKIDNNKVPETMNFLVYHLVVSHGFQPSNFSHLDRKYRHNGFVLYTQEILHRKPVIHISNAAGQHFGVTVIQSKQVSVSRSDFQFMLTFFNFFYGPVLEQHYMPTNENDRHFFVPDVEPADTAPGSMSVGEKFRILFDLIQQIDVLGVCPPGIKDKNQMVEFFKERFLNKVQMTARGDFVVCRGVDPKKTFRYDSVPYKVKRMDGKPVPLVSNEAPIIMCTHTGASLGGEEYWSLKPLLYFNKDGNEEDLSRWNIDPYLPKSDVAPREHAPVRDAHLEEPIHFEDYIRKRKLQERDPLVHKVYGITSEMHAMAKVIVLVYQPELKWWAKMYEFQKSFVSIKNDLLLRQVFTHPSTKMINSLVPQSYNIFRDYLPFDGDNQRLEFLGDSVLKFCTTYYLYFKYPQLREGQLTSKRSEITSNSYLLSKCERWNVVDLLRFTVTEDMKKPKADVMEAIFGALFIERGVKEAYQFIVQNIFQDPEFSQFPEYLCSCISELPPSRRQSKFLFDLRINIKKTCLFQQSMTCSGDLDSYERLEFLGDAFLDLVISKHLYDQFPDKQEGFLSTARAGLVKNEALAQISQKINLSLAISDPHIHFTVKRLGDLLEAFIGCLLLDCGMEKTKYFIHTQFNLASKDTVLEAYRLECISSKQFQTTTTSTTSTTSTAIPSSPQQYNGNNNNDNANSIGIDSVIESFDAINIKQQQNGTDFEQEDNSSDSSFESDDDDEEEHKEIQIINNNNNNDDNNNNNN
ncbi:hypothetical protein DFA_00033 [Cavenderia fasciculata]|uniref:Uncharacterized protein n=1 Tax=Cavenderia fasciculata TaxID=261658 RepID=F4PXE6_CACFS|nr:uncharacterized protein DFA_00033 [Cavenderia fasciculata]EGG19456.1 hypothetical protein DFA_00033 [Cavenderia fasciculata]|eukprot:XP_004357750.1 hypothetical protein DFA_00033 [Cavenderia fasciculata]